MNNELSTPEKKAGKLEATLKIKEEIALGEAASMQFSLLNRSDEELLVLKWYTPLEGIAGEILRVERDGKPVPYQGILAKRGVPQADEYVSIESGGSVSAEIDLTKDYDFSVPGDYTIEFLSPSVSQVVSKEAPMAKNQSELGPVQIPSNKITIRVIDTGGGGAPPESPPPPPSAGAATAEAKTITYDNCSASEENTVKNADVAAQLKVAFIHAYLDGLSVANRQTDQLYNDWFGTYTAARYSTVLNNWKKIVDGFAANITYNCSGPVCQSNWYAYVYAGGALEVFLCQQYWNASTSGTDTQYGILIHEVSHEVAGTKDHVYGQTGCQNLAQNDPDKAIENADNYEYFAEHYQLPTSGEGCNIFQRIFGKISRRS